MALATTIAFTIVIFIITIVNIISIIIGIVGKRFHDFPKVFDSLNRAIAATESAAAMSRQAVTVFDAQQSSLQAAKNMLENLMQTSRR